VATLVGQTVYHSRILKRPGAGGMGVVYKTQGLTRGLLVTLGPNYCTVGMCLAYLENSGWGCGSNTR
jgi:hypothetical protein